MAVLEIVDKMAILSHEAYLTETYPQSEKAKVGKLFQVKTPFRMDAEAEALANWIRDGTDLSQSKVKKRKRRKNAADENPFQDEIDYLQQIYSDFCTQLKERFFPGRPDEQEIRENNRELRLYMKDALAEIDEKWNRFDAGDFLIPDNCHYSICDVNNITNEVDGGKFNIILMDPPWENKHVKRVKLSHSGYSMLDNNQIGRLPIDQLLSPDDGLVVIWCSDNTRHRDAVQSWLLTWNLALTAKWYWLKVTKYGELICDFSQHKNPYEVIFLATPLTSSNDNLKNLPDNLVIISVPSGIHSHKPPLDALLQRYLQSPSSTQDSSCASGQKCKKLEIFAQYLQPNWVSVGNEACKLNHRTLFTSKIT
uniref:Methyltransferase-like protein 4-like protein n=1 Tax=Acartia pacifica TaxID=335913 RepID=A0A0U2V5Q6_ACAPC|nr:methyltransferase-like protein 4-like protein [Acartia pacifica]